MDPGVRRRSPCSCLRGMNVDFSCRSAVWPPIPVRDRRGWGIIMLQPFGWPTPPLLSGSWHEIDPDLAREFRSEEHTSELQSLMRISYAVFCLQKKTTNDNI